MDTDTILYLLRHGQTAANKENCIQGQTDVPLNETGLKQAALAGERLQKIHFDAIYSSDLSRAMVTAQAAAGGRPITPAKELREWALGKWQGLKLSEVQLRFPESYRDFLCGREDCRIPGGESRQELQLRVSGFIDRIAQQHAGQQILLVTHGGAISSFFKYAFHLSGALTNKPRIDNTGLCIFSCSANGTYQMLCWNDTSHLNSCFSPGI